MYATYCDTILKHRQGKFIYCIYHILAARQLKVLYIKCKSAKETQLKSDVTVACHLKSWHL